MTTDDNVIYHNEYGKYVANVDEDHGDSVARKLETAPKILSRFMLRVEWQTGPKEAQLGKFDNTPRERHQFNP